MEPAVQDKVITDDKAALLLQTRQAQDAFRSFQKHMSRETYNFSNATMKILLEMIASDVAGQYDGIEASEKRK